MIITGTIAALPLSALITTLARSGPDTDPRIRTGAAIGILGTLIAVATALCLIAIRAGLQALRLSLEEHHRDCDQIATRRDLRDFIALYRRGLAREARERRRQLADLPPVPDPVTGRDEGTGPHPIYHR